MKPSAAALALALAMAPLLAMASAWVPIVEFADGSGDIDVSSVRAVGKYRTAWVRKIWTKEQAGGFFATKELLVADCAAGKLGIKQQIKYYDVALSRVVDSFDVARIEDMRLSEVVPDSVGESQYDYICQRKLK